MLVLCKNKKPEDLLKYGFKKDYGYDNELLGYELMTKRKKQQGMAKKVMK